MKKSRKVEEKPLRQSYELTPQERHDFDRLMTAPSNGGPAWRFWRRVAVARGLDAATMLGKSGEPYTFTALPLGHGKHWCFPYPLKCQKPPPEFIPEMPREAA